MIKKCLDCNKEISRNGAKRCRSCALKERYKIPENTPAYIDGRTKKGKNCSDCGIKISYTSNKCQKCYLKCHSGKNNPNYRHGKNCKTKDYLCIDCNTKISNGNVVRCSSCEAKHKHLPDLEQMHNLTSKRFGKLIILKLHHIGQYNNRYHYWWLCKCDCGKECIREGHSLSRTQTQIRPLSCGCSNLEHLNVLWEKNKLPEGESAFNKVYGSYRLMARKKGRKFELTKEEVRDLTKQNCHYCDALPSAISKSQSTTASYIYNGIDRKDNTKGYTKDNVVPCCVNCNRAKMDLSYEEFLNLIKKIYIKHCLKEQLLCEL